MKEGYSHIYVFSFLFALKGSHSHLKALLKVAGTSFRCKAEKPITEIFHVLEDVDLHPKSLYSSLKVKIREDESAARVGVKFQLKHVPATALSPQRPSIILSPGTRFLCSLVDYSHSESK